MGSLRVLGACGGAGRGALVRSQPKPEHAVGYLFDWDDVLAASNAARYDVTFEEAADAVTEPAALDIEVGGEAGELAACRSLPEEVDLFAYWDAAHPVDALPERVTAPRLVDASVSDGAGDENRRVEPTEVTADATRPSRGDSTTVTFATVAVSPLGRTVYVTWQHRGDCIRIVGARVATASEQRRYDEPG